jgi:1-acyl-sn-glycerol-3-phosphate acyltransferase
VLPVLCWLAVSRDPQHCRRAARRGARAFFALIGSRIRIDGDLAAATRSSAIVVANHASYLDGVILTAALPPQFSFLIKREMGDVPLAGWLLRRLGSHFVDRNSGHDRNRAARRLFEAAGDGEALACFPEGTFDRRPGLRPFQPGAFAAAWRARKPLVPVVIRGARQKLGAGEWLAAPGALSLHVCTPIDAADYDSPEALLRAARGSILEHLGEPDLDQVAPLLPLTPVGAASDA